MNEVTKVKIVDPYVDLAREKLANTYDGASHAKLADLVKIATTLLESSNQGGILLALQKKLLAFINSVILDYQQKSDEYLQKASALREYTCEEIIRLVGHIEEMSKALDIQHEWCCMVYFVENTDGEFVQKKINAHPSRVKSLFRDMGDKSALILRLEMFEFSGYPGVKAEHTTLEKKPSMDRSNRAWLASVLLKALAKKS